MMRRFRKALVVLAVTGMLALLAWSLHTPFEYLAARHWRRQLEEAPVHRVEVLANRIAELGKPGLWALVDALGSEREPVATAARRALWAELENWESLTAPAINSNLAVLAEALSSETENFRPAARGDAAKLAAEVLRWLPDSETRDRLRIIAHCDRVFEYAADTRRSEALAEVAALPTRATAAQAASLGPTAPAPALPELETPDMPSVVSTIPGGGLPIETLSILGLSPSSTATMTADRRPRKSETAPVPERQRAFRSEVTMPNGLFLPDPLRPLATAERLGPAPWPPNFPVELAASSAGSADEPEWEKDFERLATDLLMRWLHSADAAIRSRAEAALRRREFTDVHIELARRLFDADPSVRMELARTLPRLTSIDPVPWLLWLSRDPHTQVRLAAISLMATTTDPALHARIRQMARDDSNAAVQRVARRLDER